MPTTGTTRCSGRHDRCWDPALSCSRGSSSRDPSGMGDRMSTTDYVVDILLIVVIFRQLRPRPYTLRTAILPIGIMVWAGFHYLRGFDIAGNDLVLITLLALSGLALGAASGATTFMWLDERSGVRGRVGFYACLTWIIGMGSRFAFAVYASSSGGGARVAEFSRDHAISGSQAWTTALVAMAFAEVLARVVFLQVRRVRLHLAGASTSMSSGADVPDQQAPPLDIARQPTVSGPAETAASTRDRNIG